MNPTKSTWFWIPVTRPQATVRLVCHPPAGADAAFYADWAEELPPHIEIWAVRMPGRGGRIDEPQCADAQELAATVADALLSESACRTALFGASLGGFVAFEVAHRLETCGEPAVALFVYGSPAPQVVRPGQPSEDMDDHEFREELRSAPFLPPEVLEHDELLELLLPTLRADHAMAANYRSAHTRPLATPVQAFVGRQDPVVTVDAGRAWRLHAAGEFAFTVIEGRHLWVDDPATKQALLRGVEGTLERHLNEQPVTIRKEHA
jgi:medium-chain acyl-[acyl-carrier-protein] hydrolase